MTTSPAVDKIRSLTGGSVHLTRLAALVIAYIVCVIIWLVADPIGGANLRVEAMGGDVESLNALGLAFSIATYGIVAWIVLILIERFAPRPRQTWLIVAIVALVLSFFPVLSSSENTATRITLILMHIGAAAVIIPVFADTIRNRSNSEPQR